MESIKLRKEILKAHNEEGYQGNDLKEKVDEVFNQELLRQERIRKDEERIRKYKKRERIRQRELE